MKMMMNTTTTTPAPTSTTFTYPTTNGYTTFPTTTVTDSPTTTVTDSETTTITDSPTTMGLPLGSGESLPVEGGIVFPDGTGGSLAVEEGVPLPTYEVVVPLKESYLPLSDDDEEELPNYGAAKEPQVLVLEYDISLPLVDTDVLEYDVEVPGIQQDSNKQEESLADNNINEFVLIRTS